MFIQRLVAVSCLAVSFAVSAWCSPAANAEVIKYSGPVYTYYDVSGTPEQILRQMQNKGRGGGFGYTEYFISYRYSTALTPRGCYVSGAIVTLRVSILLPRLAGPVTPDLQRRWAAFEPNLRKHEAGHEAIGIAAATEISAALLAIGGQRSCAETKAGAKAAADAILADLSNRDRSYDMQTEHGKTQGAWFNSD